MSANKNQKPQIETVARQRLEGELLKNFEDFLDFLKSEKMNLKWGNKVSGKVFFINYRSKYIGNIILSTNSVDFLIFTADRDKVGQLDNYLEGQSDDVIALLMERIENGKCRQCRPTVGCSRSQGNTFQVLGKEYNNICHTVTGYAFSNSGGNMSEMILFSTGADNPGPPPVLRSVPIETVKKIILARKMYVERILTAGKNNSTLV